jgi:hypothetical protein
VTTPKQIDFTDNVTIVPAAWLDRMQEMHAPGAWNFSPEIVPPATLRINAGVGELAATIWIAGHMRYNESAVSLVFSGGDSAGLYGIWVATTSDDSLTAFTIAKAVTASAPPDAIKRRVATVSWDGTKLSNLIPQAPAMTPPPIVSAAMPSAHIEARGDGPIGVAGYEDYRVMQRQAGANMSVDVGKTSPGLMQAWVRNGVNGPVYLVENYDRTVPGIAFLPQINLVVGANASGNPRIDSVILEVLDTLHDGYNTAQARVVAGTASAGATLDNRTGAAALPANAILLADILVANGAASILTANIRDRRPFAMQGVIPPVIAALDMVAFLPAPGLSVGQQTLWAGASGFDNRQSAALMYLPRRIVGATRIRWRIVNSQNPLQNNWNMAIYDASGRKIVETGTVAFVATSNTNIAIAATITATTFEAGWYYVAWGMDALFPAPPGVVEPSDIWGVGGIVFGGQHAYNGSGGALTNDQTNYVNNSHHQTHLPNTFLTRSSGGLVLPTTLQGSFVDGAASGIVSSAYAPPVPIPGLSVG